MDNGKVAVFTAESLIGASSLSIGGVGIRGYAALLDPNFVCTMMTFPFAAFRLRCRHSVLNKIPPTLCLYC